MIEFEEPLNFYASHGPMTVPGKHSLYLSELPAEIPKLCEVVQNNLIHVFWAERYGINLDEAQKQSLNLRKLSDKLALIKSLDSRPLMANRDIHLRQVGNCRDFSLLLTCILRQQGRPARARCGFARYFRPDHYEDHWVCEYWHPSDARWVMVDAQLDPFQIKTLGIDFDPLDVPTDQFITAGQAWKMCRSGRADPDQFGIFDLHGWWFIWGDVVRDFLALNKIEILPWDGGWGFLTHRLDDPPPDAAELVECDKIAQLSAFPFYKQLRSVFNSDSRFRPPEEYEA